MADRDYTTPSRGKLNAAVVYLLQARQSRLSAVAWPDEARTYKAHCRYWVAMASITRRREERQGRQLP